MSALTPGQLKHLRSLANRLNPSANVGKGGPAEVAAHISSLLERAELVKVRLLPTSGDDRRQLADELAKLTGTTLVGLLGRVAILYKPNTTLPPRHRIHLPAAASEQ